MPTKEVKVYHKDAPSGAFELVATVEVDTDLSTEGALEEAYVRTQNIHGSWSQGPRFADDGALNPDHHPSVTRHAPLWEHDGKIYGLRSSMVGDLFVIDEEEYLVANLGFEKKPT